MRLYWKTSQPVPGKGEAWVYYECDEKFNILRHLTHFPMTGEVECVAKPLVKKMTDMYMMEQADKEDFEALWEEPSEQEAAAQGNGDGTNQFDLNMTVAEAMSLHPRMSEVFAAFRLGGCGSCGIGEMETVAQVCMAYGVDPEMLKEVVDDLLNPEEEAEQPSESPAK